MAVAIGLLAVSVWTRAAAFSYWYNIGPQPINSLDTNKIIVEQDSGRVAAIAVDPSNSNHWLIGAAQGGIWETTDAGSDWKPRTDSQASMAMGAIAFSPSNPSVVYAGTGEANFRGDDYAGAGLLWSQDGGTFWQMLNTNFAKTSFSRIRVNPASSSSLVVATTRGGAGVGEEASGNGNVPGAPPRGVFVSTNGGTSFTLMLTGEATALEANRNNFNQQYAGLGEIYGDPTNGVYRTTNGWASFQLIQGPWFMTNLTYTNYPIGTNITCCGSQGGCSNVSCCTNGYICTNIIYTNIVTGTNITYSGGRIAMASSPSDPNTLYVGIAGIRSFYLAELDGIWVTTNAWAATPTWSQLPFPDVSEDFISTPRFWYMFDLLVDPADPAVVYLAEFDVWRYSGGWTSLADWSLTHVHPDNHVMLWIPRPGMTYQMLLGNDGGVYFSDAGVSGSWTNLNTGLAITQFYKGAVDTTGKNVLALGGAQDNFTSLYTGGTAWVSVTGGDGGDCAISTVNPLKDWVTSADTASDNYTSYNEVQMLRTRNGGKDFTLCADDISDCFPFSEQFYVHFEKAPYNDDLLIAGTATLWRCANFFSGTVPSWTSNGPALLGTNGSPVPISAMAFAPSDTNGLIYAYGTEDGQLRITSNGGGMWSDPNLAKTLPGRYISGLAFSPTNANVLYVTFSGFDESTLGQPGHLFKTANAFAGTPTWTNLSPPVDLPNNCLAIDPNHPGTIYVGADIGLWYTTDGGHSWNQYGPASGLPNVAVYDVRINSSSQATVFTHGRGAYIFTTVNIPILVMTEPPFHPVFGCLQCPPDEPWLNPGDLVTVEIPLQGVLPVDTVDLKATMLASPQVAPLTGTQDYGVVLGQGAAVSQQFQFIANGAPGGAGPGGPSCGGTVPVVLLLQDQGVNLGLVTIPFNLGAPSHPLVEDFDEVPPPTGLPGNWSSAASGADLPWTTTSNQPPNIPHVGEDNFVTAPPNYSAMAPDGAGVGQSVLTSPPFPVATSQAQLYFREAFAVASGFDGGILEIAIGTQPFLEISQAGGTFVTDGYNTILNDRNPLGPRAAWSGNSGGWLPVRVNLPSTAAGQTVQLRWHFATSLGMANGAWFVDTVLITEPICLPPVSDPVILSPAVSRGLFTFSINTVTSRTYFIEFKTNLDDTAWQTLETLSGNGNRQLISVPTGSDKQRFYRFQVQ